MRYLGFFDMLFVLAFIFFFCVHLVSIHLSTNLSIYLVFIYLVVVVVEVNVLAMPINQHRISVDAKMGRVSEGVRV